MCTQILDKFCFVRSLSYFSSDDISLGKVDALEQFKFNSDALGYNLSV